MPLQLTKWADIATHCMMEAHESISRAQIKRCFAETGIWPLNDEARTGKLLEARSSVSKAKELHVLDKQFSSGGC